MNWVFLALVFVTVPFIAWGGATYVRRTTDAGHPLRAVIVVYLGVWFVAGLFLLAALQLGV